MKGFDNNYVALFETGKAGRCPRCGSARLSAEERVIGRHYGVFFTCPDCGAFDHADGRIDPDNPNWHRNRTFRLLNVLPTSFGPAAVFDASYRIPVKNEIIRIGDADFKVLQPMEVSGSHAIDRVALIVEPVSPSGERMKIQSAELPAKCCTDESAGDADVRDGERK